jgi:serine/threonine-protein kinase
MGEIFLAEMDGAAGIKKKVVIKRILPHLARDPKFVERFLDEGRLVAQLSHGNLVPIFDIGLFQGQYFLAMEHVDGVDLDALMRQQTLDDRDFPLVAAIHVFNMVARALDYVHTRVDDDGRNLKIVHRDISPQNIMVSLSGEVKILDFGIARARTRHVQSLPGFVAGKIPYMSPEQLLGEEASPSSDIYGLGSVIYQLISGKLPHNGSNESELIRAIQNEDATKIEEYVSDIPQEIAVIINACLSRDLKERPPDAAHLRKELSEAIKVLGVGGGETILQKLVVDFTDKPTDSNSFDALLLQQIDGAWESATDSIAGAMRHSTRSVEIDLPHQDGLSEVRVSMEDHSRQSSDPGFERKGFKRWLFFATIMGLGLGLGLMVLLQDSDKLDRPLQTLENSEKVTVSQTPPTETPSTGAVTTIADTQNGPRDALSEDAEKTEPLNEISSKTPHPKQQKIYVTLLNVRPQHARIFVGNKEIGRGTASIRGPKNRTVLVDLRAKGFESKQVRIKPAAARQRSLTLKKMEQGTVAFRFTPASAKVFIDGKLLPTQGSNRVEEKLKVGSHVLLLKDETGASTKRIEFELSAEQRRVLGTIDLRDP